MNLKGIWSGIIDLATRFLIAETATLCIIVLLWWFVGRSIYWSLGDFAIGIGAAIVVVGVYSLYGSVQMVSNFRYRFSQTVMDNPLHERTKQNMTDVDQSKAFAIVAGICGVTTILIGLFIKSVWPYLWL